MKYDIAFSCASEDEWVAKDLVLSLKHYGIINTFLYTQKPLEANGIIHTKLREIYKNSIINVIIMSSTYLNKGIESVVHKERKELFIRHVSGKDADAIFILDIDQNNSKNLFFEAGITHHQLNKNGITGTVILLMSLLYEKKHTHENNHISYTPYPKHPEQTKPNRGILSPWDFKINHSYYKEERWRSLGDVLVEPNSNEKIFGKLKVFLIPSGNLDYYISHSTHLRNFPSACKIKRMITKSFIEQIGDTLLHGLLFNISKDGINLPHLYSQDYDSYITENYNHFRNKYLKSISVATKS